MGSEKRETVNISAVFREKAENITEEIQRQMESRAYRGAIVLQNSAKLVLRGQRNGRRYKVPGTFRRQRDKLSGKMKRGRYYSASMPGEAPAVRTGAFRLSWQPGAVVVDASNVPNRTYVSQIESKIKTQKGGYLLGEILEQGTTHMAPRPYQKQIREQAAGKIRRIYREPYF